MSQQQHQQQQEQEQSQSSNGGAVASDPSVESHAAFEVEGSFESAHPAPSVASAAQRRANRKNARKSTGPRTPAGKARARRNAVTHGAFMRDALLPGEDPGALCDLIAGAYAKFSPQDAVERALVDRVVDGEWKIRRLRGAERFAYGIAADRRADHDEADYLRKTWQHGRASRHRAALRRVLRDALHDDVPHPADLADAADAADAAKARAAWQARDGRHEQPPGELAGALDVAQAVADPAGVIERFGRICQRLEQSVSRATRELRQLRADAREAEEEPLPCPYLELEDEEDGEQEGGQGLEELDEQDGEDGEYDDDEQEDVDEEDLDEEDVDEEDAEEADAEDPDAEEVGGAAGVVTSVTMSDPAPDIAQNEPNFPRPHAGVDDAERYDEPSCNIDLVALMRRAAADAAARTGDRRRDRQLA